MRYVLIVLAVIALGGGGYFLYTAMHPSSASCASRQPRIVAFGDSLVAGYGAAKGEDIFSVLATTIKTPIRNLGVSGDTSAQALARIDTVLAEKPDIVIVLIGGNDALQGVPVADTEATIGEILTRLKGAGVTPVLAGVLGGFPTDPFKPMFERLAKEYDVTLVPNVLAGFIGDQRLMSDAIHPNAEGYARIADRIAPILESACASS